MSVFCYFRYLTASVEIKIEGTQNPVALATKQIKYYAFILGLFQESFIISTKKATNCTNDSWIKSYRQWCVISCGLTWSQMQDYKHPEAL
jgi:hypothetical protein